MSVAFDTRLLKEALEALDLEALFQALLFGLRVWASVCLALYVAFWLELDDASGPALGGDRLPATFL
jgi:hypothetical protein